MTRRVRIPDPRDCNWASPRFYIAQYDATEGEYYGLCRETTRGVVEYRRYIKHAMSEAVRFTDEGEKVHCIYECFEGSWTRYEFAPAAIERGPEWGEW